MDAEKDKPESLFGWLDVLLGANDAESATLAIDALLAWGAEGAIAVSRRVRTMPVEAQRAAIRLAVQVSGAAGLRLLEQLLQLGDEEVENDAINAIGGLGEPAGMRPLLTWLGGSSDGEQSVLIFDACRRLVEATSESEWRASITQVETNILAQASAAFEAQLGAQEEASPSSVTLASRVNLELQCRKLTAFGTLMFPDSEGLEQAFHREALLQTIEERLSGSGNRSFILVGPSGCGKATLIHEVCRRLGAAGPAGLMLQTSSGFLLAGTKYLGEWQTRLRDLVDVAKGTQRLLLYVTDINNLLGAGTTAKSEENIGDFLAPHVESGALTLVAKCTPEELARGIEQRPAFRRLFDVITVEAALPGETERIAVEVGEELAQRVRERLGRRLVYQESFFPRLLEVADQFRSAVARPGRAVDLLGATVQRMARVAARGGEGEIHLGPHHIIEMLARDSGVPQTLLDDRQPLSLEDVRRFLSERVIGQPQAVAAVVNLVTLIKAGLSDPTKPTGVLFFVGPTGVGKTELAKSLAEYLFGSSERMLRLDMTEFNDVGAVERLIGNPQAAEWSPHRHGLLTGPIRQQPMSVVLLDEFEKAHRSVFDLLLQVMDDGRLTDAAGRVAHFTQAIVIMTSNIGGAELVQRGIGFTPSQGKVSDDAFRHEIEKVFRPEFVNRVDRVVAFSPLDTAAIRQIVGRELGRVLRRSGIVRRRITVEVEPSVVEYLTEKGFDPRYGARPLKREVERRVLLPLGEAIVALGPRAEQALLRLAATDEGVAVEVLRSEPESVESEAIELEVQRPGRDYAKLLTATEALHERVFALEKRAVTAGLEERKSLAVEASAEPTFWSRPELARRTLSEIHWLEKLLAGIERVRKRTEDLRRLVESHRGRKEERVVLASNRLDEIDDDVSLMSRAIRCTTPESRADCFLLVERLEGGAFSPDPVLALLKMYVNWARRHHYHVDVLDETEEEGRLRSGVLFVEGLCPYGILGLEGGIHQLVSWDESGKRASTGGRKRQKTTAFCRVRVLQVDDDGEAIDKSKAKLTVTKASGKGLLIPRYKTQAELRYRKGNLRLSSLSDKGTEEASDLLFEWMRAELQWRRKHPQPEEIGSTPVRTYRFGQRSVVRDDLTSFRIEGVDRVLDGGLQGFLEARLDHTESSEAGMAESVARPRVARSNKPGSGGPPDD